MSGFPKERLGDVVLEARSGFACGEEDPGGVFQFRMHNITREGVVDLTKRRRVPPRHRTLQNTISVGDVLFNATNSPDLVGKTALVRELDEVALFSNHFLRLRADPSRVTPAYLSYWLQAQYRMGAFRAICKQWVNQATVSREALLGLRVPLPPVVQQDRATRLLDQIGALQVARRRAMGLLDDLAHSIFTETFQPGRANSTGWPACNLEDMCEVVTKGTTPTSVGLTFTTDGVPFVRAQNLVGGTVSFGSDDLYIDQRGHQALRRSRIIPGDVLISIAGTVGRSALVPSTAREMNCNQAVAILRLREPTARRYVREWLTSRDALEQIASSAVTATISNLSLAQLRSLKIRRPPVELQEQFAARVAAVDELRREHQAHLAELDTLFASLQHRAFNGELWSETAGV